jgi:hypothetical protein
MSTFGACGPQDVRLEISGATYGHSMNRIAGGVETAKGSRCFVNVVNILMSRARFA